MLPRLQILLAQVKAGDKSKNLLKEMRQNVYSLYRAKPTSEKICNNLLKSI